MSKMKKSPFKLLICVVDQDKADLALKIIKNAKEGFNLTTFVQAEERSRSFDLMALNRHDCAMITGLVRADNATRTLQGLDLVLCPDDDRSYGIAMTVNLSSMSREMLNYFVKRQKEAV